MPIRIVANPPLERPTEASALVRGMDARVIWIDLLNPTPDERRQVERLFGIELPTLEDMKEIETTSRLYAEDGARFMTAPILSQVESSLPQKTEISFILVGQALVTIRETNLKSFGAVMAQCDRRGAVSRDQVLLSLLDAIIDRQADLLERVAKEIDSISQHIFQREIPNRPSENVPARHPLRTRPERRSHRPRTGVPRRPLPPRPIRGSNRFRYPRTGSRRGTLPPAQARGARLAFPDGIRRLPQQQGELPPRCHARPDPDRAEFHRENLHRGRGHFPPPTLVASIYGMNFAHMPELSQKWGYPFALFLMVVSVVLPLWYCRRKNWL